MVANVLTALVMAVTVAMGPEEDRLRMAVRMGDAAGVKAALAAGADAYEKDHDGVSIAHLAVMFAESPVIRGMIAGGVEFKRLDVEGWSALDLLLWRDHVEADAVMALIEASVDRRQDPDASPLATAAAAKDEVLMRHLLAAGFEPTAPNDQWSPLAYAIAHGSPGSVRVLIEAGANIQADVMAGHSPLHLAAIRHDAAARPIIAALVAAGVDPDILDGQGFTPLSLAALHDCTHAAEALLDGGAEINLPCWNGETALTLAAGYASLPMVELLISRGANVNTSNDVGGTALIAALTTGDPTQLLQRLHEWEWATLSVEEAITRVERRNIEGVIRALLDAGANPNSHGTHYWSPLAYAAHMWDFNDLHTAAEHARGDNPMDVRIDGRSGIDPHLTNLWERFSHTHDPVRIATMLVEKGAMRYTDTDADPLDVAAQRTDARRIPMIALIRTAPQAERPKPPPSRGRF